MSSKLKNRLLILMTQKEQRIGRRITQSEIAEETGVSIQLVGRWLRNDVTLFKDDVIVRLCDYFECEVGDLLYIDRSEN